MATETSEPGAVRALASGRGDRHRLEHVMGMPVIVDVCDPGFEGSGINGVYRWLRYVDETFSTYRPDSQISRMNRGELALGDADAGVRSVLERCLLLRERTGGYFDPWALGDGERQCDPSGLVKGWAIEEAARILERQGARNFCVNAGGDLVVRGHPEDAEEWRVGIRHPRLRDGVAVTLLAVDCAIATSGTYERGEHIIEPHTGQRPEGLLSVTVAGPDLGTADAYATAIYAMGHDGPAWALGLTEYAAMVILTDDTVLSTPNFEHYRLPAERMIVGGGI
jgi:thiamine biosynthesis lipoprotein